MNDFLTKAATPFERFDVFHGLDHTLVLAAGESTGYRATGRVIPLNSMENRVFLLEMEDVEPIVVKFYRPGRWNALQLLTEHAMSLLLSREGFATPEFVPITDKSLCFDGQNEFQLILDSASEPLQNGSLGKIGHFFFCVWKKVSGRAPLEMNLNDLEAAGRLIARMHTVLTNQLSPSFWGRHALTTDWFLLDAYSHLEDWGRIPKPIERSVFAIGEQLLKGLEWMSSVENLIPVHGDLHRLNLIQTSVGGNFWFVDFDDAFLGPDIQDLWLLASGCDISQFVPPDSTLRPIDLLATGYGSLRKLNTDHFRLIEPLRTFRMIHYMGWIAKRWDEDALFPQTFAFFQTETYWERTLNDLENQIADLRKLGLLNP
jgi:Ser/Thr protein kinase RdoA (MazF antagonist)